ncbi:MAG: ROK family transcriptional regulator [Actinomycetota bacterium]|nr:ROK family transcriptional regulator [Actinomycetota bacterium]
MGRRRDSSAFAPDLVRTQILTTLGSAGSMSRSDLMDHLGLSAPTVTENVRRLIDLGFVRELSPVVAGSGRPRVPIKLIPDAAHVAGLAPGATDLNAAVIGLDGSIATAVTHDFAPDEPVGPQAARTMRAVLDGHPHPELIRGVGVGLPGVVDGETGIMRLSGTFGPSWTDRDVRSEIAAATGLPTVVDNELRASTVAELLFGLGRDHDDFGVLGLGDGVGFGMVLDREVLRGPAGIGGELGHVALDPDNSVCLCGNRGCLQAKVRVPALLERAVAAGAIAAGDGLDQLLAAAPHSADVRDILLTAGQVLGRAIAIVVNLLGIQALRVIGTGHLLWPYLRDGFEHAGRAATLAPARGLEVVVTDWSEPEFARSAACLMLAQRSFGLLQRS